MTTRNRSYSIVSAATLKGRRAFEWAKPTVKELYRTPVIRLAGLYRSAFRRTVFIGVTGSCGKTTAKDLIAAALSEELRGSKSTDSNNRLYAVARTVLLATPRDDFCVQEIGADGPGSLDDLLRLQKPHIGVVTTIGGDHYSAFRTVQAVVEEKGKLVDCLPANGTAVLNADDPHVLGLQGRCKGDVVTFGCSPGATVRAERVSSSWPERLSLTVSYRGDSHPVHTKLCGVHWVPSVLAALATAVVMGVPLVRAIRGVAHMTPRLGRMYPVELPRGITFIRDDWKASYWSVPAVLEFVRTANAQRKIIIFGTLSDCSGKISRKYRSIAADALDVADHVCFVGGNAHWVMKMREKGHGSRLHPFQSAREANHFLQGLLREGDLVLMKSSVSDHLARLALAREQSVNCWRTDCERKIDFCDRCYLLNAPMGSGSGGLRADG